MKNRKWTKAALAVSAFLFVLWWALETWSKVSPYTLPVKDEKDEKESSNYAALIVYMPEEVGNKANYRGFDVPQVKLGIKVFAQQANAPLE